MTTSSIYEIYSFTKLGWYSKTGCLIFRSNWPYLFLIDAWRWTKLIRFSSIVMVKSRFYLTRWRIWYVMSSEGMLLSLWFSKQVIWYVDISLVIYVNTLINLLSSCKNLNSFFPSLNPTPMLLSSTVILLSARLWNVLLRRSQSSPNFLLRTILFWWACSKF